MAARYGAITRGGAGVRRARGRMNPEQDWEPIIISGFGCKRVCSNHEAGNQIMGCKAFTR
ncbi:hypothetical protein AA18895_0004 [Acetobacter ghanensis DSM 18895]|nr:hypothetical protein AA18895_0004 [Acetobacter ghanensis DSM 18895]